MSTEPPGPSGEFVFGNSRQYARDPFDFLTACAEAYGEMVRFDLGPMETYMLTAPEEIERVLVGESERYRKPDFQDDALGTLLGDGLLLSEGETWRKQRELANPSFNMSRISGLAGTMADRTEEMLAEWADGDVVDVEVEMARLTVKIIVETMLGVELDDETVRTVQENLEPLGARFEPDPLRFVLPDWVPTRENRDYAAAIETMEGVVDDVVARRRGTEGGEDGPMDFLSVLLRAQSEGEQTDRQIRDEVMTMLLAGHDTTALTLTYTWYLLSQHPEAERRVHEEVDAVCGGDAPTMADVREFEYVEWVLQEAMRLYPPVYVIFREPKVDVKLAGYRVPAGSAVMLPQWVVHRSERFYDDPTAFEPERWRPERRSERPQFSYFPFGGGPRHCIGRQFSLLEAKVILGTVAQRYSLSYDRDEPFDLRGSLTMHPQEPVTMRLDSR